MLVSKSPDIAEYIRKLHRVSHFDGVFAHLFGRRVLIAENIDAEKPHRSRGAEKISFEFLERRVALFV